MDYQDPGVGKESKELVKRLNYIANKFPPSEPLGFVLQIRRAAISIPPKIAEGIGRIHTKESIQFLNISRGSLFKLKAHLNISKELFNMSGEEFSLALYKIKTCKKLVNGFINQYKTLDIK